MALSTFLKMGINALRNNYPFNFNDYAFSEVLNEISPNKRFLKENISSQEVHKTKKMK